MPKTKSGFYAVRVGRNPGVYTTWNECRQQTDNFRYPKFKKFDTEVEAWKFVHSTENGLDDFCDFDTSTGIQTTSADSCATNKNVKTALSKYQHFCDPVAVGKTASANARTDSNLQCATLNASNLTTPDQGHTLTNMSTTQSISHSRPHSSKRSYSVDSASFPSAKRVKYSKGSSWSPRQATKNQQARVGFTEDTTLVSVYTDGACEKNGRDGAKAGIGVYWGPDHHLNTSERLPGRQTNNRAEIHAAVKAIEQAKSMGLSRFNLMTDSQFLIKAVTMWIKNWKKKNWVLSTGEPVKNEEDFKELERVSENIQVNWVHVRGHRGIAGNEAADLLARQGAKKPICVDLT